MNDDSLPEVSHTLLDLHRLRSSLHAVPTEKKEQFELLAIAERVGTNAVPLCVRALAESNSTSADWAVQLILAVTKNKQARSRAIRSVQSLLSSQTLTDNAKIRAASLIGELGGALDQPIVLANAEKFRRESLVKLSSRLKMPKQLARAAEELVSSLEGEELCSLVDDLSDVSPPRAAALMEELLLRDDLEQDLRIELHRARTLLQLGSSVVEREPCVSEGWIGKRSQGGMVALARDTSRNPERVLVVLVAPGCLLLDAHYQDDLASNEIASSLIKPLGDEGFVLEKATIEKVRRLVCKAARKRAKLGIRQPRDFYLGRDLLGIHDEFLPVSRRLSKKADQGILFARAMELLRDKQFERARAAMGQYVSVAPRDPEGHSGLGVCLLKMGNFKEAENHFRRAQRLDPSNRQYTWNLAVAAQRAGRLGDYKQNLAEYVATSSACPEIDEREERARELLGEVERLSVLKGDGQSRLPGL